MDLDKIREFRALSKTLNFTQTARSLNISASTLSKHVQALENELDVTLLTRGINGDQPRLTEAGKAFLNETGPWLETYDAIVQHCRELRQPDPPARIHGVTTGITNVTSQITHAFTVRGINPVGLACIGAKLPAREALDKGIADFAYYFESIPGVRWIDNDAQAKKTYGYLPLAPERLYAVVRADDAASAQGCMTFSEIEQRQNLVMSNALYNNWIEASEELFQQHGHSTNVKLGSDLPMFGGAFPLKEGCIAIVPDQFAKYYVNLGVDDVRICEIEGDPLVIYSYLIYRKDSKSASAQRIVRTFGGPKP